MKKKDTLYTVNKFNKPMFAKGVDRENNNVFDGWGDSILRPYEPESLYDNDLGNISPYSQDLSTIDYALNKPLNLGLPTYLPNVDQNRIKVADAIIAKTPKLKPVNIPLHDPKQLTQLQKAGLGIAGQVGNTLGHKLISNGLSSTVGDLTANVGNFAGGIVGQFNPFLGAAIQVGSGVLGGGINAFWGSKLNDANIAKINSDIAGMRKNMAGIKNNNNLVDIWGNTNNNLSFSKTDVGRDGVFAHKAADTYNDLAYNAQAAKDYNMNGFIMGARNADKLNDERAQFNSAAFGGQFYNNNNMGAIDYGFMQDYLTMKGKQAEARNKLGGIASVPNTLAYGGLWAEGRPEVRKMLTFARNSRKWNKAYGGFLDTADNLFAIGGDVQMHGGDYSNGAIHINEGNSHEENPYDGVQVGVDPEGTPNLVEEGEVIFNDYVYSNRILCDDETKEKFHISKKREISFADLAKKLEKESSERPNDPISKAALKVQMESLAEEQERQKAEMQAEEAREAFEALSPEEQVAVMQQAEAQQADTQAQQEAMMQEQAMAEQQAAMQQQGMPMGIDAAMQGQMMPQGVVPEGGMMQAYGGPINQFAYGGNLFVAGGDKSALARKVEEGSNTSLIRRILGNGVVTRFVEGMANDPYNTLSGGLVNRTLGLLGRMSEAQLDKFFDTEIGLKVAEAIIKVNEFANQASAPDVKGQVEAGKQQWYKQIPKITKNVVTLAEKKAKKAKQGLKDFGDKLINGVDDVADDAASAAKPTGTSGTSTGTGSPSGTSTGTPEGATPGTPPPAAPANPTPNPSNGMGWKGKTAIGAALLATVGALRALVGTNNDSKSNGYYIDESSGTSLEGGKPTGKTKSGENGRKIKEAIQKVYGEDFKLRKGTTATYNNLVKQVLAGKIDASDFLFNKMKDIIAPSTVVEGTSGYYLFYPEANEEEATEVNDAVEEILQNSEDPATGSPVNQGSDNASIDTDTNDMYAGKWNEGTLESNWKNYTLPGLQAYMQSMVDRYNEATTDEERKAIQDEAINTVNGIQEAYSKAYQKDTEHTRRRDEVGELQRRFNTAGGNAGFANASNNVTRSSNSLNGDIAENNYTDSLWGPFTSIRNWGSTQYGADDPGFYRSVSDLAKQMALNYAPGKFTYGTSDNDIPYTLYGLSREGEKPSVESDVVEEETTPAEGVKETPKEEKTTVAPKGEKVGDSPIFEYIPRYFGLGDLGPLVALDMQASGIGKSDYSGTEAAVAAARNGLALADYRTAGNYFRYNPMDVWAAMNRQDANTRATERALTNSSMPVSNRAAGLLVNNYQGIIDDGELYNKGWLANADQALKKAQYDTTLDQFNAGAFNQTSATNAQILNHNRQFLAQLMMQKAREDAEARASWYRGIYGNVDNLFEGLGKHERENRQGEMIAGMINTGLFGHLDENTPLVEGTGYRIRKNESANGGKLNRKKRKGGLTY